MATSPSFTTSYTSITSTSSSQTSTLPPALSPANLDTIPVLTSILTRLQPPTSGATSTPGPSTTPLPSSFTSSGPSSSQLRPDASGPLTTKEIPAATDALKHRLQRARVEVARLPGIEMGIQEQEEEIRRLEERVRRQREVLEGLRDVGVRAGRGEDVVMQGIVEGK